MNVRVLFFSVLKDITGAEELAWECAAGATVADLLNQMYEKWPKLGEWDGSVLLAVDQVYVRRNAPLHEGAEVAVMPPVQGG
jgi:MoaD family protein